MIKSETIKGRVEKLNNFRYLGTVQEENEGMDMEIRQGECSMWKLEEVPWSDV